MSTKQTVSEQPINANKTPTCDALQNEPMLRSTDNPLPVTVLNRNLKENSQHQENGGHIVEGDSSIHIQCKIANSGRFVGGHVVEGDASRFGLLSATASTSSPKEEFWPCQNCAHGNSASLTVCSACNYGRIMSKHVKFERRAEKNRKKGHSKSKKSDDQKTLPELKDVSTILKEFWTCQNCSHENSVSLTVCSACNYVRIKSKDVKLGRRAKKNRKKSLSKSKKSENQKSLQKPKDVSTIPKEFWTCHNCLHENSASVTVCDGCKYLRIKSKHMKRGRRAKSKRKKSDSKSKKGDDPKPISKPKDVSTIPTKEEFWTCQNCSHENSLSLSVCEGCNYVRMKSEPVKCGRRSKKNKRKSDTKSKKSEGQKSMTKPKDVTTIPKKLWICRNCSHENMASLFVCDACNYVRMKAEHVKRRRRSKKNRKKSRSKSKKSINSKSTPKPKDVSTISSGSGLKEASSSILSNFPSNPSEQPTSLSQEQIINKKWHDIDSYYRLQKKNYTDDSFPPTASSLYYSSRNKHKKIVKWLRLCNSTVDNCDKHLSWTVFRKILKASDIYQGSLGDCWLISCLIVLAERTNLVRAILRTDHLYSHGLYQLRICKDGNWISVLVDDLVPCDSNRYPLYAQAIRKQLWVGLIEKAMAKINGCYEALTIGNVVEGLATLTGAPCETILLNSEDYDPPTKIDTTLIWAQLLSSRQATFLMVTTSGASDEKIAEFERQGIEPCHSYAVLDVREIGSHCLLKLQNPNANVSWIGDWSNSSYQWTSYLWDKLMPNGPEDQVFWMCFRDFLKYFYSIGICKVRNRWHETRLSGVLPPLSLEEDSSCVVLTVTEPTEVDFMLHQDSQRHLELSKRTLVDLCLVVFKFNDDGSSYNFIGSSKRYVLQFVDYYKMFEPGTYIIIPLAFNHWHTKLDVSDYPKYVLAIHSSRRLQIQQSLVPPAMIRVAITALVMLHGNCENILENAAIYSFATNFSGTIVMVENRFTKGYLQFKCDTAEHTNVVTTRSTKTTVDVIPPLHRQVIAVVTHDRGSEDFWVNQNLDYRFTNDISIWEESSTTDTSDEAKRTELHRPTLINECAGD